MSLRNKIVLILASVALLYVATDVAVLRTMIAKPFQMLENEQVAKDNDRVKAALGATVDEIEIRVRTLGSRTDTAEYLAGAGPRFAERVLSTDVLAQMDLNLLFFCSADGNVVWGRIEESESRAPITVPEFPGGRIDLGNPLYLVHGKGQRPAGMMNTSRGPMLVAMHALSDAAGDPLGAVIGGRFFDASMRAEVRERTHVHADVWSALDPLPEGPEALRDEITAGTEPKIVPVSDERIDVYTIVNDVRDQPTLILRSSFDRAILAGTNRILDFALLSTVATALIILLVLLRLLDRIVLRPLSRLTRHAAEIGRTEDMSRRVAMERHDELGKLSDEFDGLMGKLQHSREQVIETARVAGMSEIATGILHNVGNVLNSVNVSTNLAVAKAERLAVRDLQAMTDLLIEHRDDLGRFVSEDPRGRQFLPFLGELTREMSAQRESIVNELRSLGHGVDHVIELVRNQQSYAGMSGVFEPTDLAAAINAALAICEQAYTLRGDIEIVREYEELPRVAVDKHKLMEILVNLIQNAGQIMRDAETPQKRLTCRLRRDGENTVRIEVEDNGPGIAVANLARIFAHGFTTRPGGHGFGLHVSANAATEMKASLHARSDGPGTGATFVLQLPLKTNEVALAA